MLHQTAPIASFSAALCILMFGSFTPVSAQQSTCHAQYSFYQPGFVRTDGYRVSSGSYGSGWNYEIWKMQDVYYLKAWRQRDPQASAFTLNWFTTESDAYQHFKSVMANCWNQG